MEKIKKIKGLSMFETLMSIMLVSSVGISVISFEIKQTKEKRFLAEANLPIELLKAVDMRIEMDGYNYNLWNLRPKIKNRVEIEDFAKKAFVSKYNTSCGKRNGWNPQNDENRNKGQKNKTNLIPCNFNFGTNNLYEMEILTNKNINNNLASFDIILKLNKKIKLEKETLNNQMKLLRKIKSIIPKTKKGIINVNFFNYNDLTTPILLNECRKEASNCIIKASWISNGYNEALRLDGTNNIIDSNISFAKTYRDNNNKCILWQFKDNKYKKIENIDCGIGIYKDGMPTASIQTLVDNTYINEDVILDKSCNIYDGNMNVKSATECGIVSKSNKIVQVVNKMNIDAGNKDAMNNSLTVKDLFAKKITTSNLEIKNNLIVENNSSTILKNLKVKEETNLNKTIINTLDVKEKTLFESNVSLNNDNITDEINIGDSPTSNDTKFKGSYSKEIDGDLTARMVSTNQVRINNINIRNGSYCDKKENNDWVVSNNELLKCRRDNNGNYRWLNKQEGRISYFLGNCPAGWNLLSAANGSALLGSGKYKSKYKEDHFYQVGNKGGESFHKLTIDELPSHNHKFKDAYYVEKFGPRGPGRMEGSNATDNDNNLYTIYEKTSPVGQNKAFENRTPFNVVNICQYQKGKKEHQNFKKEKLNLDDYWFKYTDEISNWIYGDTYKNCSADNHLYKNETKEVNGKIIQTGKKIDIWIRKCDQKMEQLHKGREKNSITKKVKYTGIVNSISKYQKVSEIWKKGSNKYFNWTNKSEYYNCGQTPLNKIKTNNGYSIDLLCKIDREREYQERLAKNYSGVIVAYRNYGKRKVENKSFIEKTNFNIQKDQIDKKCTNWESDISEDIKPWIPDAAKYDRSMSIKQSRTVKQFRTCELYTTIKNKVYDLGSEKELRDRNQARVITGGLIDLHKWFSKDTNGVWAVNSDGSKVHQYINTAYPTLFESSSRNYGKGTGTIIKGFIKVNRNTDDDFIGFVMGRKNDNDFFVWNWKGHEQWDLGLLAKEGHSFAHVTKNVVSLPWNAQDSSSNYKVLGTNTGANKGWRYDKKYKFRIEYLPTRIRLFVDDILIINATGSFPEGGVGFYNTSQENVDYFKITEEPYYTDTNK